uniref:Uncharacterized protein n=1 Tax=Anguilla anguilla TaxID=7936 RepID=A0A0E9WA43_ANGAN
MPRYSGTLLILRGVACRLSVPGTVHASPEAECWSMKILVAGTI